MAPTEWINRTNSPVDLTGQTETNAPNITPFLRRSISPGLDGVFFCNRPTMNSSDSATMISRFVASPAAGEVDG